MSRQKILIFALFLSLLFASAPYFLRKSTSEAQAIKSRLEIPSPKLDKVRVPVRISDLATKESVSLEQYQAQNQHPANAGSFERFQSLVSRSQAESAKCQSVLKDLRDRQTHRASNPLEVLDHLQEVPLVPASALDAIQMVEEGNAKNWEDERFFQTFGKLGNCSPVVRLQLLRQVLKNIGKLSESDPIRRAAIEAVLTDLKRNGRATTFFLTQQLQLALLSDLIDAGLISSDISNEASRLKDETAQQQRTFQSELEVLSRQGEHRKAIELEMNHSDRIRTQLNGLLEKIRI